MEKTICELFAGVGGFRVGFERLRSGWTTTWFSQWEPGKKKQWAHDCYVKHYGDCLDQNAPRTGEDIAGVDKKAIPNHTVLVGGFPCQDYSVAHTLSSSKGIEGKKGVLWWEIFRTLEAKNAKFCLFENVDRLLKSPANQRGRDFGIILVCLCYLGYVVEWRVVNAAQYGSPQRRRRVFIFAAHSSTKEAERIKKLIAGKGAGVVLKEEGLMARAFRVSEVESLAEGELPSNGGELPRTEDELKQVLKKLSDSFAFSFSPAGVMVDGRIYTAKVSECAKKGKTLGEILEETVDEKYFIPEDRLDAWRKLKGAKKIMRTARNGHVYQFSEGAIAFPDPWDRPARTMLTSESTLNRSSHVVEDKKTHRLRILTPDEAELLQGFERGWTANVPMPERMRYFCMGNALVTEMVTEMAKVLDEIVAKE